MDEKEFINELYETIVEDEVAELGINIEDPDLAIVSEDQANFFLRRISEIRDEKEKINSMCDSEIERFNEKVNSFRQQKLSSFEATENYFLGLLEKYATAQLDGTKKKSIKLPFGTLQFRKVTDKYEYNDELLKEFMLSNKDQFSKYIKTKEDVVKADIKKDAEIKDGKVYIEGKEVPGISVTEGGVTFSAK